MPTRYRFSILRTAEKCFAAQITAARARHFDCRSVLDSRAKIMSSIASGKPAAITSIPLLFGDGRPRMTTSDSRAEVNEWTLRTIRIGAIIVVVARLLTLALSRGAHLPYQGLTISLSAISVIIAIFTFCATYSQRLKQHWQLLILITCAASITTMTVFGALSGRIELLFVSVVVMIFATSALLPWSPVWQGALSLLCFALWESRSRLWAQTRRSSQMVGNRRRNVDCTDCGFLA